jgi:hypothetical protein
MTRSSLRFRTVRSSSNARDRRESRTWFPTETHWVIPICESTSLPHSPPAVEASTAAPRAAAAVLSHPRRPLLFLKPTRLLSSRTSLSSGRLHPRGTLRPIGPLHSNGEESGDAGDAASCGRRRNEKKEEATPRRVVGHGAREVLRAVQVWLG